MKNQISDIGYISEKLIDGGYKLTRQRYEIIKTIYDKGIHMSADEIYKKVRHKKIGLSTVYRNLMVLEMIGVLKQINVSNMSYYELQTTGESYIHAKCIRSNKIIDIKKEKFTRTLENLINNIKEEYGMIINDTSIVMSGICEDCINEIRLI